MMLSRARRLLAGGLLLGTLVALLNGCQTWTPRCQPGPTCGALEGPTTSPQQTEGACPKVSEAMACVTVRPRGQLGLKLDGTDTPLLENWGKKVGVPLEQVACFAVVLLDEQGRRVLLVRTKRPIDRGAVRRACEASTATSRGVGKSTVHVAASGLTVHFPRPTLAVIADSLETMKACLAEGEALQAHLTRGGKHDLTLWARGAPVAEVQPQTVVASYRAAAPLVLPKVVRPKTGLFGQPLPFAVKTATLSVDVGEAVELHGKVVCEDEASAGRAADCLRTFLDMGRGGLLLMAGQFDLMTVFGEDGNGEAAKLRELVPLDLVRPVEKALQKATVAARGKTVVLRASLPVRGQRAGMELNKLSALAGAKETTFNGPGLFFEHVTARAACGTAPPATALPPTSGPAAGPPNDVWSGCGPSPCLLVPAQPTSAPASGGYPVPASAIAPPLPSPAPVQEPPPPMLPPAGRFQLSVANCRKEPVLLFRVETTGALTLLEKVAAGDVVDLLAQPGERLAAVFLSAPHQVAHVTTPAQPTWLLRQESARPPVVPVSSYELQRR